MTEPRQLPPEFRRRRPWPTTEMQRVLATEHHSTRGLLLRVAEDAPHPTGRAAAAVVAGARRKRARGGAGVRAPIDSTLCALREKLVGAAGS